MIANFKIRQYILMICQILMLAKVSHYMVNILLAAYLMIFIANKQNQVTACCFENEKQEWENLQCNSNANSTPVLD